MIIKMKNNIFSCNENINFKDYSLVLSSVSVGNVPQLAIDLLITNYNLTKISTVWHPAIVPCVGSDPYFSSNEICTACELFVNQELKIIVMQLRSTLIPQHMNSFFHQLKEKITEFQLKKIIILTSIFDYELHNIESNKFFFICNVNNITKEFVSLQQIKDINGKYFLNGGGFAVKLYEILEMNSCIIIGKYVSEGDNRPDAYSLLLKILPIIGIQEKHEKVIAPSSWSYLFGRPAPQGIF